MNTTSQATRGICHLFERDEIKEFIEQASTAAPISIFAGAGISIESGFPDWNGLVFRLLRSVAVEDGLSDGAPDEFANWTMRREGLTAAAAVAQAYLGDEFSGHLHQALYDQKLTPPAGQSALAIARLMDSFGPSCCDVVTTNYDLVLDKAIDDIVYSSGTAAAVAHGAKKARVRHLHGIVTPRGCTRGELILSDRDYFLMQEDSVWQQRYFAERFADSTCIFVGASLTDPNLLRYLHRSRTDKPHFAIFVRQQDAGIYDESAQEVVDLREKTSEARWKNAGIHPIHVDFYSQSTQLLHEIIHRRNTADRRRVYHPLPRRLARWRNRLNEGVLSTQAATFQVMQNELQAVVNDLLAGIRDELADAGHRPGRNERLGISMWVYDPRSESLANWASADRIWLDAKAMEPFPIDWTSDFVSVQAFCAGSLVSRSTEKYVASRWNHVIGAPLHIESEKTGRLPVGAVTIASTLVPPESVLHRGMKKLRWASLPRVEGVLADFLR